MSSPPLRRSARASGVKLKWSTSMGGSVQTSSGEDIATLVRESMQYGGPPLKEILVQRRKRRGRPPKHTNARSSKQINNSNNNEQTTTRQRRQCRTSSQAIGHRQLSTRGSSLSVSTAKNEASNQQIRRQKPQSSPETVQRGGSECRQSKRQRLNTSLKLPKAEKESSVQWFAQVDGDCSFPSLENMGNLDDMDLDRLCNTPPKAQQVVHTFQHDHRDAPSSATRLFAEPTQGDHRLPCKPASKLQSKRKTHQQASEHSDSAEFNKKSGFELNEDEPQKQQCALSVNDTTDSQASGLPTKSSSKREMRVLRNLLQLPLNKVLPMTIARSLVQQYTVANLEHTLSASNTEERAGRSGVKKADVKPTSKREAMGDAEIHAKALSGIQILLWNQVPKFFEKHYRNHQGVPPVEHLNSSTASTASTAQSLTNATAISTSGRLLERCAEMAPSDSPRRLNTPPTSFVSRPHSSVTRSVRHRWRQPCCKSSPRSILTTYPKKSQRCKVLCPTSLGCDSDSPTPLTSSISVKSLTTATCLNNSAASSPSSSSTPTVCSSLPATASSPFGNAKVAVAAVTKNNQSNEGHCITVTEKQIKEGIVRPRGGTTSSHNKPQGSDVQSPQSGPSKIKASISRADTDLRRFERDAYAPNALKHAQAAGTDEHSSPGQSTNSADVRGESSDINSKNVFVPLIPLNLVNKFELAKTHFDDDELILTPNTETWTEMQNTQSPPNLSTNFSAADASYTNDKSDYVATLQHEDSAVKSISSGMQASLYSQQTPVQTRARPNSLAEAQLNCLNSSPDSATFSDDSPDLITLRQRVSEGFRLNLPRGLKLDTSPSSRPSLKMPIRLKPMKVLDQASLNNGSLDSIERESEVWDTQIARSRKGQQSQVYSQAATVQQKHGVSQHCDSRSGFASLESALASHQKVKDFAQYQAGQNLVGTSEIRPMDTPGHSASLPLVERLVRNDFH